MNPTNPRGPISRLRKALGVVLIGLGLTIQLGPIVVPISIHFDQASTILWQYVSGFGLFIYGLGGLLPLVVGLWIRRDWASLIGFGLAITLGFFVLLLYMVPPIFLADVPLYWRHPWIIVSAIGFVIVIVGLWVRRLSLRPITV